MSSTYLYLSWFCYILNKNNKVEMIELEKRFYNLRELCPIVNLKYRQLQVKVKNVEAKFRNRMDLIYKQSNRWFIHPMLFSEFKRERRYIDYKLFITIASQDDYQMKCWETFVKKKLNPILKEIEASTRIKYVIEKTQKGVYHLHIITNFSDKKKLSKLISTDYFTENMNTKIVEVYNIKGLHQYFRKQNKPVLLK
jgi:hypothetical protein